MSEISIEQDERLPIVEEWLNECRKYDFIHPSVVTWDDHIVYAGDGEFEKLGRRINAASAKRVPLGQPSHSTGIRTCTAQIAIGENESTDYLFGHLSSGEGVSRLEDFASLTKNIHGIPLVILLGAGQFQDAPLKRSAQIKEVVKQWYSVGKLIPEGNILSIWNNTPESYLNLSAIVTYQGKPILSVQMVLT